ncbi:MAG: hypothetical protein JOZ57_02530 [Abitibacteriaceae bacterium]|nr:hypothetical protein [Abditibacteriaceae bacterium]
MDQREGQDYLMMYPKLRQWINQCVACQTQGYKPEMPEQIYPGVASRNLRRYFRPLAVDELGLCKQCREALARLTPPKL